MFVDGYHSAEQARFDHEAFRDLLSPHAIALFHDSMITRESSVYGSDKAYMMTVVRYIDELRADPYLQVFDVPFANGLTLVRKVVDGVGPRLEGREARSERPAPNP